MLGPGNGRSTVAFGSGDRAGFRFVGGGSSQSVVFPGGEVRITAGTGTRSGAERGVAFYVRAD